MTIWITTWKQIDSITFQRHFLTTGFVAAEVQKTDGHMFATLDEFLEGKEPKDDTPYRYIIYFSDQFVDAKFTFGYSNTIEGAKEMCDNLLKCLNFKFLTDKQMIMV